MKSMCNKHHKHPRKGRGIQSNCKFVTPFFGFHAVFARILSEELLLVNDVFRSCLLWCLIQPDPSWPSSQRPLGTFPWWPEPWVALAIGDILALGSLGAQERESRPRTLHFEAKADGSSPESAPCEESRHFEEPYRGSLLGQWKSYEASSEMKSKQNAKLEKQTVSLKEVLEKLPWEHPGPRRGCFWQNFWCWSCWSWAKIAILPAKDGLPKKRWDVFFFFGRSSCCGSCFCHQKSICFFL